MTFMQMSFAGAVMILVISLIRMIAVNKLPKRVFLIFWGVALLRLLLPISVSSVFSIYTIANQNETVQEVMNDSPIADLIPMSAPISSELENSNNTTTQIMPENPSHQNEPIPWMFLIWCAGMAGCMLFFMVSYLKCRFEFQTSLPVQDDFVGQWLLEHPLRRKIEVRQTDRISAPLSYGLFHPIILLPSRIDWKNDKELSYVLTHEYIHIRRIDLLTKFVLVLTCCIHWFNPMVWLMYVLFNRDLELSCDENVVKQFGENSKETYAGALIHMEEKRSLLMPFCNSFSKTAIEERIRAIMKTKKVTVGVTAVSVIAVLTVIIVFATSAKPEKDEHLMADFDVPDVVVERAKEYVLDRYHMATEGSPKDKWDYTDYIDWRIESLKHVYTYEDFYDGKDYEIYQLNYQFLAKTPDEVPLVGGMTITEDGWVVPEYAYSSYYVYEKTDNGIQYVTFLFANDGDPGDGNEPFTSDLKLALDKVFYEKTALENSELKNTFSADDIGVDYIYRGAFTKPDAKEVFVDCRFLNVPHVGGLDRRMFLLFDEESSELLTFKEVIADKLDFTVLPCADGHNTIAVCASATSQGFITQRLFLCEYQGTEWIEKTIEPLTDFLNGMEEYYLWLETDQITVTPSKEAAGPDETVAILRWNMNTEEFEGSYLRGDNSVDLEKSENFYQVATHYTKAEVEFFAKQTKQNFLDHNWEAVAKDLSSPFTMDGVSYESAEEFLTLVSEDQLSPEFFEAIEEESCDYMFVNFKGIMFGDGQIWFSEILNENLTSQGLKIYAINGLIKD